MRINPKISLEEVVITVARCQRSYLIAEAALNCVDHKPEEKEVLRARIKKIVKKLGLEGANNDHVV
jgi:hypothetical protein